MLAAEPHGFMAGISSSILNSLWISHQVCLHWLNKVQHPFFTNRPDDILSSQHQFKPSLSVDKVSPLTHLHIPQKGHQSQLYRLSLPLSRYQLRRSLGILSLKDHHMSSRFSLIAQLVNNLPAMQETPV